MVFRQKCQNNQYSNTTAFFLSYQKMLYVFIPGWTVNKNWRVLRG